MARRTTTRARSARQRAVLGLLEANAGNLVTRQMIIDALWGKDMPVSAVDMVHTYVSRLRRTLEPARSPRDRGRLLASVGTGYELRATTDQLDLLTFGDLTAKADAAAAAQVDATVFDLYEQALRLYRGEPLADIDLLQGHPAVAELARQWVEVVLRYAETACALGQYDRALPRLHALAMREPLNERAHRWLMIALAGSGQQSAALHVFEDIRLRLDEELGVYPCAELSEAHKRVLRQEIPQTGTVLPHAAKPASPGPPQNRPESERAGGAAEPLHQVPRQLPAAVSKFTGRKEELRKLCELLDERPDGCAVVISAIGGTAGVGKTALAVQWAHQAAERFPDGQLYVNLRGYDPDQPVSPADALAAFLRALGVLGQDIPAEVDERAARYRSLLAGRRILVQARVSL